MNTPIPYIKSSEKGRYGTVHIICLFLRHEEAKLHIQIYLYKVILEGQKHKKLRPRYFFFLRFWDLRQQNSKDRDSIPPPTLELHESIHLPKVTKSLGPLFSGREIA